MGNLPESERRKNGGLSIEQYEILKTKLRAELREDLFKELWDEVSLRVGRTILSKGIYILGAILLALGGWLTGAGHIKIPGATE
jgi:hypothetical protein